MDVTDGLSPLPRSELRPGRHRKPTVTEARSDRKRLERQRNGLRRAVEELSEELDAEKQRVRQLDVQKQQSEKLRAAIALAEWGPPPAPVPVPEAPLWARAVRKLASSLLGLAVVAALGVACAVAFFPAAAGATTMKVLSGSMSGTFSQGDVVVSRPVDVDTIEPGDVITFVSHRSDSAETETVTHRVVEVRPGPDGKPEFVTKGDANVVNDIGSIKAEDVKGKLWYHVPYAGKARDALFGPAGMFYGAGILMALVGFHFLLPGGPQDKPKPNAKPRPERRRW